MLVLVPHEKQKCQVKKAQVQEGWRSRSRESKTNPHFHLVNKPSRIGPHDVLQLSLIDTVFYLLEKNNKGRGDGVRFKTEGGLLLIKAFFL